MLPRKRVISLREALEVSLLETVDTEPQTRAYEYEMEMVIISPNLTPENKVWRFSSKRGNISAKMKDQKFRDRLLSGYFPVPMMAGVVISAKMKTREHLVDGIWTHPKHEIVEVLSIVSENLQQRDLGFPEEN